MRVHLHENTNKGKIYKKSKEVAGRFEFGKAKVLLTSFKTYPVVKEE
jgi:hypothetical protein